MLKVCDIRRIAGFPFPVSSAYRCPYYNNKISTTGLDGPHPIGRAIDIVVYGYKAFVLMGLAIAHGGFTGIGLKQTGPYKDRFIHLDDLTEPLYKPRPWIWTY